MNNIITEQERNFLLEQMKKLLDEYDYEYTDHALNKILDVWSENKSTLIEAFKKHPKYLDGKFMIAFEEDYERGVDQNAIATFCRFLGGLGRQNMLAPLIAYADREGNYLPQGIYDMLFYNVIDRYTNRTVNAEFAEKIKNAVKELETLEGMGEFHIHIGEKTTRLVNRLCSYIGWSNNPDYNRQFSKYADALTPITIKRHTIISLNPLDYLTMSFGNSWASCHTIDKTNRRGMPNSYEGQYSSGTMSYMLDPSSIVLYTVDGKYDGNEFYTQPKINRQMFHYGEEKLVQGRLYPQSNDCDPEVYTPYRNLMQEIISQIFDFPNLWTISRDKVSRYTRSYGTHYQDYVHFNNCKISIPNGNTNESAMKIGRDPICIECGNEHDIQSNINCCRSGYKCADCGAYIEDEDDVYWVDDEPYCRDCVCYCDCCNEYYRNEDTYEVHNGRYTEYVCEECRDEHYFCCEDCDEWYPNDEMYTAYREGCEVTVCSHCVEEYTCCEECGELHHNNDVIVIGDSYYCPECAKEIEAEAENEETESEEE